jgi:hypothetical protein
MALGKSLEPKVGHAEQNGKPVCHRWDELAVLWHNMSTHKEALFTHYFFNKSKEARNDLVSEALVCTR